MKTLSTYRKPIVALLATIVFALTLHGVSEARTYSHIYVDAVNGVNAPTGRGAAAKPYQSISFALLISTRNNLPDPWHVHIRPGTYDADPAKPANAREIFPLRLRQEMIFEGTTTAAECIIDGHHTGATTVPILLGENTEGVTIRNLTIRNVRGTNRGGRSAIVLRDPTGTKETPSTLEGCVVHNNKGSGGMGSTMPLILTGNTFSNNQGHGVWTNRSTAADSNTFIDNGHMGLAIEGNSTGNISKNVFQNNLWGGLYIEGTLEGEVTGNIFIGNRGHHRYGPAHAALAITTVTGNITGNEFARNVGSGMAVARLTGDITDNTFTDNRDSGVRIRGHLTGNITNNEFIGNGEGMEITGHLTGNITNNEFIGNGEGMKIRGHLTGNITNNEFTRNTSGGPHIETLTGKISHNLFDSNSAGPSRRGGAFRLETSTNTVEVSNNIFFNNTSDATGNSVVTRHATHFMNNLFMISDALSGGVSGAHTIWVNSPGCRFHNNIFSNVKTAIYTEGTFDLPITHNLFHNVKVDFVEQAGNNLGNDLLFWELVAVNASNNLEGAPQLVDPVTTRDFHLQATSPAINAGSNAFAPADDFDGVARPVGAAVDIGPYEYGGTPVTMQDPNMIEPPPPPPPTTEPTVTTIDGTEDPVGQTVSPADVLVYIGGSNWISLEDAAVEAETTQSLLQTAGISSEITEDADYVGQWMLQTTSDGSVDVLILYGAIPTTIYPSGNIKPDGSIAENWIETLDGNTILNQGDYFGYWGEGAKSAFHRANGALEPPPPHTLNGPEGLQNIMDIPGITMSGDNTPMTVTVDGIALTPSLMDFQTDRPFHLDELQGGWFAEKIFASNTGDARATRADPVIVRDGNRGRIAIAHQTAKEDNPKGEVAAEIIINYLLAGETLTTRRLVDPYRPPVTTNAGTEEPVGQTVRSGDKITGPWLWMIAPTAPGQGGQRSIGVDSLSDASGGAVTEADVAANGANEGDLVANLAWTLGEISDTGGNNVNALVNAIGFAAGDVNDHSSYALITLESTSVQNNVTMRVGSDDAIKVWLNGEVVHTNAVNRGAGDFQDVFPVNLRRGDNLLLVKVSERGGAWSMFVGIDANVNAIYKPASTQPSVKPTDTTDKVAAAYPAWDVNEDGQTDVADLLLVVAAMGQANPANPRTDVNRDGTVDAQDILLVVQHLGESTNPAAPASVVLPAGLTPETVQHVLTLLRTQDDGSPAFHRSIALLEQILASLIPKETALLANYPNPFNPETWLPYHLATSADVTLRIYAVNGTLVRHLALGHQPAGHYQRRGRAAYWDGKNEQGEPVASGVYFYTLTAGDFTSTRKMLIQK